MAAVSACVSLVLRQSDGRQRKAMGKFWRHAGGGRRANPRYAARATCLCCAPPAAALRLSGVRCSSIGKISLCKVVGGVGALCVKTVAWLWASSGALANLMPTPAHPSWVGVARGNMGMGACDGPFLLRVWRDGILLERHATWRASFYRVHLLDARRRRGGGAKPMRCGDVLRRLRVV